MADEIIVKYTADVSGFKAEMKSTQAEIKATETTAVNAGKATTDSFKKTENATVSLKTQLKQLKAQLAVATDPKDIERLARAAGEIENKLGDATKAAKIFASDSKFEQVRTAIGGIGRNILSLNFKQAAVESNLLVSAVRSITFKESIAGLKDLATSLLNVGKALLSNPLFLIGATIGGIVLAYQKWNEAEEENKKIVTQANREKLDSLKAFEDFQLERLRAQKKVEIELSLVKIQNGIAEQERLDAEIARLDLVQVKSEEELANFKKINEERLKVNRQLELDTVRHFSLLESQSQDEKEREEKDLKDSIEKQKKHFEESDKALEDSIEKQKKLEQQAHDFELKLIADKAKAERDAREEKAKRDKASADENAALVLNTKPLEDKIKREKELEDAKLQEEFQLFTQAANAIFEYQNNLDNAQIDNLDQSLKRGAISQEQYDKKVAAIRLAQAKRDRDQALFNIAINTAEAVIRAVAKFPETFGLPFSAFALATGAIQAALVASKPLPKFAEGTERVVGGQKGVDSVHALLMPDEAVIKANENMAHPGLAKAWNSGYLDQFIMEQYIEPKLSAILGDSMANNMAKSAKINGLNEYSLARVMSRNKGVNVQNADYIAKAIAREMRSDNVKRTWSA